MTRQQIYKLVVLTLKVQEQTQAYASLNLSSIGYPVSVHIMDNGFSSDCGYDGFYNFSGDGKKQDEEMYKTCVRHLERLLQKNSPVPDESNGAKENKSSLS